MCLRRRTRHTGRGHRKIHSMAAPKQGFVPLTGAATQQYPPAAPPAALARPRAEGPRIRAMPVAFVLSIGGVDGDFQVGALRYLYNRGIIPDIVCGSSAGAINAAAIAQGEGGLDTLEATWL